MSDVRQRLRALLGEPPIGAPLLGAPLLGARSAPSNASGGANAAQLPSSSSVHERLARRADRTLTTPPPSSLSSALSTTEPRDLTCESSPDGDVWARRVRIPIDERHGTWRFDEVRHADRGAIALAARDAALAGLDPSEALYLDTETTGLAGGAGTLVFLVGIGRLRAGAFELWQGFLRDPSEERALLAEVARQLRASSGVVTFFGKSFDRHRLEDRMRVLGIEPPFGALRHLDLYHPLRRLYGASLDDLRLRTVESALCGVERAHDLPGSFAPAAWFDFVAGRPHRLEGVFEHNAADVASLVVLAAHLGRTLAETRADGSTLAGDAHARAAAWSRVCRDERRASDAVRWFEEALARGASRALELDFASHLVRMGEHERAFRIAVACTGVGEDEPIEDEIGARAWLLRARIESARKELASALTAARTALAIAERTMVGPRYATFAAACRKRETSCMRALSARATPSSRARASSSPPSSA